MGLRDLTQKVKVEMAAVAAVRACVTRPAIVTRRSFVLIEDQRLRFGRRLIQLLNRKRHGLIGQKDDGQRDCQKFGKSKHEPFYRNFTETRCGLTVELVSAG